MINLNLLSGTRTNTLDFKPPRPNTLIQGVFKQLLPFFNNNILSGLRIEIDAGSLAKLKAIRGERCLLMPNHPAEWDPIVIFNVARQLKENFFYVAAREVFDYDYGLRGWLFQRLGVYSLVRGSNDRGSFKTSLEILAQNKGRLVIFVEGEISNQNDSLLPLESGVVQLAFMALNDVYKQNGKDIDALPPLYVCPTGIRYVYDTAGLTEAINGALARLEDATGLPTVPNQPQFERMTTLAKTILTAAAAQFGYTLNPDASLAQNVSALSDFMLVKLEQVVNLPPDATLTYLDRIRRIRNLVDRVLNQGKDQPSPYQKRLFAHQQAVLQNFYVDLTRVVNFVAIYDGYLHPEMTEHRTVEMIRRMEREVYGSYQLAHPRKAIVKVQGPINLKPHFQAFLDDKRSAIQALTQEIEEKLYQGL